MHGFIRGHAWFYSGGPAWFYSGGVRGCFSFFGYNEIRSMSGRYASYSEQFDAGARCKRALNLVYLFI